MKLIEAKEECERWLAYNERQRKRSIAMVELAADRRNGICDDKEARRRLAAMDNGIVVYDGAKLDEAVRCLLLELSK